MLYNEVAVMKSFRQRIFLNTFKSFVMVCFVVSTSFLMLGVKKAQAVDPTGIVTYQGRILDDNGVPVADASLDIVFKLVSDSAGTACYWSDSSATCASETPMAITLTDGLFSVNLGDVGDGFTAAIPNSVFGDDASVYLEVIIEGETLLPRKLITAAPYALNSQTLDGIDSTGFLLATGDIATGIYDFTGSVFSGLNALVFEGAMADDFESIFAFSDPTVSDKTITFKDESGTVAYLSDVTAVASKWTDSGPMTYLTSTTDDFAVGGVTTTSSPFAVDESANSIYIGEGNTSDGNIIFKASDADTGTLTYTALDTFAFTGGDATFSGSVTANDYTCSSGDCVDFTEFEDTLDLDGSLTLNQDGNIWVQNFTGTTFTGFDYSADSLTTGTAFSLSSSSDDITSATLFDVSHAATYMTSHVISAPTTEFSRTLVSGGELLTITSPVASISNNVSATGGLVIDAGYLLLLDQNSANGTGAMRITDDGGGSSLIIEKTSDDTSIELTPSATTATVIDLNSSTLTTGIGLSLNRSDSITDFSNTTTGLVYFTIEDIASSGDLMVLHHQGTGKALDILTDDASGFMATFTADSAVLGGSDDNDGISIQACSDSNPTTGCDLIKFYDGNGTIIGAIEGNGAGGIQLTSGGGADFAELFPGNLASFTEGDLIGISPSGEAIVANDTSNVIGVLSVARIVLGNATENWESAGTSVPVAMLGQVPVKVNNEGGIIEIGDYISLSSVAGVGKKSTGVGYVIGRALESAVGDDTISVFVQPTWQAQDILLSDGSATDVLSDLAIFGDITVLNELNETTAQITDSGDLAISGNIYPSDRGTLQTEKYIYYDGSSGPGGDFMRTNASGWATGSYDFAEMFPSNERLVPGEVVVFGTDNQTVVRSSGITYDERIAGIISTRPGFLAGDNNDGDVPVALAGRVPTNVSAENGNIAVGDPLTTSTRSGYAMKATKAGPIVGYAMEPFSGVTGVIVAVVRPSYFDGGSIEVVPEVNTSASGIMTVAGLDVSGALNMNAGSINNVGSLSGIDGNWRIEDNGDFVTDGRLISVVKSYQNEDVETYAVTSRETTIQLSGTATLQAGSARVNFEDIDPGFNDVIADLMQYRVFLTPSAPTGQLFAMNRTLVGFDINDLAGSNGVMVDWMVVAYHKDFAPTSVPIVPATNSPAPEVFSTPIDEPTVEPTIDPTIFEEPIIDSAIVPEPDIIPEPTPEVVVEPAAEPVAEIVIEPIVETSIDSDPSPVVVSEASPVADSVTTP